MYFKLHLFNAAKFTLHLEFAPHDIANLEEWLRILSEMLYITRMI